MSPNLPADFINWLKNKKENDYWYLNNSSNTYALEKYNEILEKLKNQDLPCRYITWFVNNICNLSCDHCGVSANDLSYDNLSIIDFANIIPELIKLGTEYVTLSGGEPFLRKDIIEIIELLHYSDFKVGIVTNGSKISKYSKKLLKHGPDSVTVSIDGLRKNHDKIRGKKGSFEKALDSLEIFREVGVKLINVHTCIYPENLDELDELREIFFNKKIDQWVLRPIFLSGRADGKNQYSLSDNQVKNLLIYAKNSVELGYDVSIGGDLGYLGKLDSILSSKPYFDTTGWSGMVILPNGDIKAFNESYLPIEGNILKDNIKDIWYDKFTSYRFQEIPQECISCEYHGRCRCGYYPALELGKRCIRPILRELENEI